MLAATLARLTGRTTPRHRADTPAPTLWSVVAATIPHDHDDDRAAHVRSRR